MTCLLMPSTAGGVLHVRVHRSGHPGLAPRRRAGVRRLHQTGRHFRPDAEGACAASSETSTFATRRMLCDVGMRHDQAASHTFWACAGVVIGVALVFDVLGGPDPGLRVITLQIGRTTHAAVFPRRPSSPSSP